MPHILGMITKGEFHPMNSQDFQEFPDCSTVALIKRFSLPSVPDLGYEAQSGVIIVDAEKEELIVHAYFTGDTSDDNWELTKDGWKEL